MPTTTNLVSAAHLLVSDRIQTGVVRFERVLEVNDLGREVEIITDAGRLVVLAATPFVVEPVTDDRRRGANAPATIARMGERSARTLGKLARGSVNELALLIEEQALDAASGVRAKARSLPSTAHGRAVAWWRDAGGSVALSNTCASFAE